VRGQVEKVRAGEAGPRIVQIARHLHADAIVMPMPRRRPPGKLLSPTLTVVLAKRPCRVIIDSTPAERIGSAAARATRTEREEPALVS
jgi:APA family basic amino acid/polyamine antiporter